MESWIEIRPLIVAEGVTRRQAEGEAWRAIVRERLGADVVVGYNERGAPVLAPVGYGGQVASITGPTGKNGTPVVGNDLPGAANTDGRGGDGSDTTSHAGRATHPDDSTDAPPRGGFIGVSHTRGWVAVVWSAAGPCAIDIELKGRKLSAAVAARYSISTLADWCALEAAYKYESVAGAPPAPARISYPPHPELVVAVIL